MTPLLVAAASAWTLLSPLEDPRSGVYSTKSQISEAAASCKTKVVFSDLPLGVIKKSSFGYEVDPNATKSQRECLFKKVPSTRVGFIVASPADLPASTKKH